MGMEFQKWGWKFQKWGWNFRNGDGISEMGMEWKLSDFIQGIS